MVRQQSHTARAKNRRRRGGPPALKLRMGTTAVTTCLAEAESEGGSQRHYGYSQKSV